MSDEDSAGGHAILLPCSHHTLHVVSGAPCEAGQLFAFRKGRTKADNLRIYFLVRRSSDALAHRQTVARPNRPGRQLRSHCLWSSQYYLLLDLRLDGLEK